jgi:hypothetical protein
MSTSRDVFQQLALARISEARHLLAGGFPAGAYYLAGYAVECALKAQIAGRFSAAEIPDLGEVRAVYTHDLVKLMDLAGLKPALEERARAEALFERSWWAVSRWSEAARYRGVADSEAALMVWATGDVDHGLLPWIKRYW